MQQLFSAFGIEWELLIAQAVNFGIVLVALWYFLYKPVLAQLEKRREVVAKGVEDAERAGELLAGADGEASKRVSAAEGEAEQMVAVTKDAEARASEVAVRARKESEREVARLAVLAAEKILKKHYD